MKFLIKNPSRDENLKNFVSKKLYENLKKKILKLVLRNFKKKKSFSNEIFKFPFLE